MCNPSVIDTALLPFPGLNDKSKSKRFLVLYRRNFGGGMFAAPESVESRDYTRIGYIAANDMEDCFCIMQGENWSPEGEAREHIVRAGTDHTSMSVGDMIFDLDLGTAFYCAGTGWAEVHINGVIPS